MNKIRKVVLASVFFIVALSDFSFGQVLGDFGSVAPGNWGLSGTWGQWDGVSSFVPCGVCIPGTTDNVFITPGNDVIVEASLKNCKDLTVQTGALLWASNSVVNSNVYVNVWGTSIVCDGTIGAGALNDNISFNIEGTNCTITGAGTFDGNRIRKSVATNATTNLAINMNVNLRFTGSSLTQIYNDAALTNFNVTVGNNSTLTCVNGSASIDGAQGGTVANALEKGGSFTVSANSTMDVQGILYNATDNANPTYINKWYVYGELKAGEIKSPASSNAKDSLIVYSGGKLNITGNNGFSVLTTPAATNQNFYHFKDGSTCEYSSAGAQGVKVGTDFGGIGINSAEQQYYDLIISGGGTKTPSGLLSVRNDLTITNSTGTPVLDGSTQSINLGGTWTNYSSSGFNEGVLTAGITFNRNPVTLANPIQYINCPGGEVYNNMTISKTGPTAVGSHVNLNADLTVNKILLFANIDSCPLVLNKHTLKLTSGLTTGIQISNTGINTGNVYTIRQVISETEVGGPLLATNPGIIEWTMGAAAGLYVFPFGADSLTAVNIPVSIRKRLTASNVTVKVATRHASGGQSNYPWDDVTSVPLVSVMPSMFVPVVNAADSNTVDRWWEVGVVSPSTFLLVDSIQFSYRGSENTLDPTYRTLPLKAQNWIGTGWDKGVNQPCSYCNNGVTTGIGKVVLKGVSPLFIDTLWTFQPWVMTSVSHPLPIKLLYFTAKLNDGKVDVNWATASEINNKYFYVERSRDGKTFEDIGILNGAGNSTVTLYYGFKDQQPYSGLSYYRLRQEDYDGKVSYSERVAVLNKEKGSAWYVFPNPAKDIIKIASSGSDDVENSTFSLLSPEGTLIKSIILNPKDQSVFELDIRDLSNGVYFGRITSDYSQQVFKVVKN